MKKAFLIFILLFVFSALAFSQPKGACENVKGYRLDEKNPSVYINFERFGKAKGDWKESRIGELNDKSNDKSKIEKGDDVWLRLYNNSCWDISLQTDSLYISKDASENSEKPKIIFGIIPDGAIANIQYRIEEQNRKQVPYGSDMSNLSTLQSGKTALFCVFKEHLSNSRSIYVDFNYEWETDKWSNNLAPLHRAFFWGYRLKEEKEK
jgi:hypothetical protein